MSDFSRETQAQHQARGRVQAQVQDWTTSMRRLTETPERVLAWQRHCRERRWEGSGHLHGYRDFNQRLVSGESRRIWLGNTGSTRVQDPVEATVVNNSQLSHRRVRSAQGPQSASVIEVKREMKFSTLAEKMRCHRLWMT